MSFPLLSIVPHQAGDALTSVSTTVANQTSSILSSSQLVSFARLPSHCRSPTGLVGRLLAYSAGRLVVFVLWGIWRVLRAFGLVFFNKYAAFGSLVPVAGFLVWCGYSCREQHTLDCPSSYFSLLPTVNPISYVCGSRLHLTIGMDWFWLGKFDKYRKAGSDLITVRNFFHRNPEFVVAGASTFKVICADRTTYSKPVFMYSVLNFFGKNVVTTEGEEWHKHRQVVRPSFQNRAYPMVWNRTSSIIEGMMVHEKWDSHRSGDRFTVNHVHNLTSKVALAVIAQAGFGLDMSWSDHVAGVPESGSMLKGQADHARSLARWGGWTYKKADMSVQQSLRIVATHSILRAVCPKIGFWFPTSKMWAVDRAFNNLEMHLNAIVDERRQRIMDGTDFEVVDGEDGFPGRQVEKCDLFGLLIRSAMQDHAQLNDREVIGNLYIFLLAGHETTANSLAFTFALLSLNPDAQQKMYEEVIDVCGEENPTYEHYQQLRYTLGCYNESIRLFPPVNIIPKVANVETTLICHDLVADQPRKQVIPAGSYIMLDVVGLHYNPRHCPEPESFQPERFMDMSARQKEAFFPFSGGSRRCIGRHFTEVESVCAMATFIQKYKLIPGHGTGASIAALQKQLLQAKQVITLTPVDCPITFERR